MGAAPATAGVPALAVRGPKAPLVIPWTSGMPTGMDARAARLIRRGDRHRSPLPVEGETNPLTSRLQPTLASGQDDQHAAVGELVCSPLPGCHRRQLAGWNENGIVVAARSTAVPLCW